MNIKTTLLHLSLIKDIGPATIEKLVQELSFINLTKIYSFNSQDLVNLTKLPLSKANLIVNGLNDKKLLEDELNILTKNNINYICVYDQDYPEILKNAYLPPTILYVLGQNLKNFNKTIAIVGSRKADAYGQSIIDNIIPELVKNQWCIVSGGALGIDTMSHFSAINNNGNTVAVLGSGLLKPYPSSNKNLFRKIVDSGGSIVSPFSLKMQALAGNFPARNRIIAGLSQACVVIQATEKSGALITAQYALEQGKEICAVPGLVDNPLSIGCHKLISQGAFLINSSQDIFNVLNEIPTIKPELKQDLPSLSKLAAASISTASAPIILANNNKTTKKLGEWKEKILNLCSKPKSFDEILLPLKIDSNKLQDLLFDMQLENTIKQDFSGFWVKSI